MLHAPRATLEAVTVRGPTRPPRLGADFLPVVGYADDAIIVASSSRSQRATWPTTTLTPSDLPRAVRGRVRGRPLASVGVCGGCYSFSYSPAKGAQWWWPRV